MNLLFNKMIEICNICAYETMMEIWRNSHKIKEKFMCIAILLLLSPAFTSRKTNTWNLEGGTCQLVVDLLEWKRRCEMNLSPAFLSLLTICLLGTTPQSVCLVICLCLCSEVRPPPVSWLLTFWNGKGGVK